MNEIVEPNLADQVARFSWFHSIDLGNGVVTPGAKRLPHLQQEANAILGPCYLNGRSVLDVGAWDGYFSFEAKRRGAEYVLATDKYAWSEWPYGIGAFELARRHLGLDVDCRVIEVADIDPSLGSFDVVLFLGVFYHLFDPLTALGRVASVTKDVLVVETHQEGVGFPAPIMTMFPSIELNRDPTNWWAPNPLCMRGLFEYYGFPRVFYRPHPFAPQRGIYHAFRAAATVTRYMSHIAPETIDLASWEPVEPADALRSRVEALEARTQSTRALFRQLRMVCVARAMGRREPIDFLTQNRARPRTRT